MASLILGPHLRHIGERDATIWVETDAPCLVEVIAGDRRGRDRTFTVGGHHYAIVVVDGLEPGSSTPYGVELDGKPVWPQIDLSRPPSRIRTPDPTRPVRLVFGSCREPDDPRGGHRGEDPDVLIATADRMARTSEDDWPDALVLLGDQVYADDTSPAMQRFIRTRRDIGQPPKAEVADFEEYTRLYRESWSEPSIRWLLSTLPTAMIFDDHDIRDDWNTSHRWRVEMARTPWWDARITGGLMSYWLYQHLGNLNPKELAENQTLAAVRAASDGEDVLREFARAADREADGAKGAQWSFRQDIGRVRLLVIDSRCGRILAGGERAMVGEREFAWIEAEAEADDYDHLIVATSMPWLLPRALHEIESWDESIARSRHRSVARIGEWLRRSADLEHWAAFRQSFDRLARLFGRIAAGEHGFRPPATITVLSGDVHHTYAAEVAYPDPPPARVYQVTCSPFNNTIPRAMKLVFHVGWSQTAELVMRAVSRLSKVPPLPIRWRHPTGPHFGNAIGTITYDGRSARLLLERSEPRPGGAAVVTRGEAGETQERDARLVTLAEVDLTGRPRPRK